MNAQWGGRRVGEMIDAKGGVIIAASASLKTASIGDSFRGPWGDLTQRLWATAFRQCGVGALG